MQKKSMMNNEFQEIIWAFQSRLHTDRSKAANKLDRFLQSQNSVAGVHLLIDILKNEESDLIQKDTFKIIAKNADRLKASAFELTPRLIALLSSDLIHIIPSCAQILQEFVRQSWIPLQNLLPQIFPLFKAKNKIIIENTLPILHSIQPFRYSKPERENFYQEISKILDKSMLNWIDAIIDIFLGINPVDGQTRIFFYEFIIGKHENLNLSKKIKEKMAILIANQFWSLPIPWKKPNKMQISKNGKYFAFNENIVKKYINIAQTLSPMPETWELPENLESFLSPMFFIDFEPIKNDDKPFFESTIAFNCTIKSVFQNIPFRLYATPSSVIKNLSITSFNGNTFQIQVHITKSLKYVNAISCPIEIFNQHITPQIPLVLFARGYLPEWGFTSTYHLPEEVENGLLLSRMKLPRADWKFEAMSGANIDDNSQTIKMKCSECGLENIVIQKDQQTAEGETIFYCEFCGQKNPA